MVKVGPEGRVEHIQAKLMKNNLRKGPRKGRGYTERIKRFVESLGMVKVEKPPKGEKRSRVADEVGHVVGDSLCGPTDKTYNFFPTSPYCNMEYYNKVEKPIYEFLDKQWILASIAHVTLDVQFDYVDYYDYPNRPRRLRIKVVYSAILDWVESFEISNL